MQAKQLVDSAAKPGAMQRVLSLQLEAFWQRHGRKVIGAGAVFALYMLWWVPAAFTSMHTSQVYRSVVTVAVYAVPNRILAASDALTALQEDNFQRDVCFRESVRDYGRVWFPGKQTSCHAPSLDLEFS